MTLGVNLLPDFYNQTKTLHQDVIEKASKKNEADSELIIVNFGLRSKVFINKI